MRKRDLQYMVEDMLAERRAEMLEVLMNKVHRELKQEIEMNAQATNAIGWEDQWGFEKYKKGTKVDTCFSFNKST